MLSLGAVFSLIYGIRTPSKGKREISSEPATVRQVKEIPLSEGIVFTERHAKKSSYDFWGRNPFIHEAILVSKEKEVAEPLPKLTLNGILWQKEKPLAVINGGIVGVGGAIGPLTVVDIKKNYVILNDGTRNFKLSIWKK